jgi:hypothetical protein
MTAPVPAVIPTRIPSRSAPIDALSSWAKANPAHSKIIAAVIVFRIFNLYSPSCFSDQLAIHWSQPGVEMAFEQQTGEVKM